MDEKQQKKKRKNPKQHKEPEYSHDYQIFTSRNNNYTSGWVKACMLEDNNSE